MLVSLFIFFTANLCEVHIKVVQAIILEKGWYIKCIGFLGVFAMLLCKFEIWI